MASLKSAHLNRILTEQYGSANLQVVFLDVVGYSKRKSTTQRRVIENFTRLLQSALTEISKKYVDYAQNRGVNFSTDIIRIPTGDGAALVFTFEGLHMIALDFANEFVRLLTVSNSEAPCNRFAEYGWCNCHSNFRIRIGIAEGRGIVYEDINRNANVAGTTINMASRVMGLANPMQIILTAEAYKNLIDMTTDVSLENKFRELDDVQIKHGQEISVFIYADDAVPGLNADLPYEPVLRTRLRKAVEGTGFPSFPSMKMPDTSTEEGRKQMEAMISGMENMQTVLRGMIDVAGLGSASADKTISSDFKIRTPKGQLEPKEESKPPTAAGGPSPGKGGRMPSPRSPDKR